MRSRVFGDQENAGEFNDKSQRGKDFVALKMEVRKVKKGYMPFEQGTSLIRAIVSNIYRMYKRILL